MTDTATTLQAILEEEEELISAHRAQIERNMSLVRDEMNLLGEVCCANPQNPADAELKPTAGVLDMSARQACLCQLLRW